MTVDPVARIAAAMRAVDRGQLAAMRAELGDDAYERARRAAIVRIAAGRA